jgi:hypothetical protein
VSSTMSHAAAMVCMPLPTKNTPPQIHKPRKAGWRRGLHKEVEGGMGDGRKDDGGRAGACVGCGCGAVHRG